MNERLKSFIFFVLALIIFIIASEMDYQDEVRQYGTQQQSNN